MNPYWYKESNKFKEWGGKWQLLFTEQLMNLELKREIETSSFGKYHSNNYRGHIPQMHANISEWTFEEKQSICVISKYLSQDIY